MHQMVLLRTDCVAFSGGLGFSYQLFVTTSKHFLLRMSPRFLSLINQQILCLCLSIPNLAIGIYLTGIALLTYSIYKTALKGKLVVFIPPSQSIHLHDALSVLVNKGTAHVYFQINTLALRTPKDENTQIYMLNTILYHSYTIYASHFVVHFGGA